MSTKLLFNYQELNVQHSTSKNSKHSQSPVSSKKRRQQALQRLGCDDPRCIYCGESDPLCLEKHHIAGQAYHDVTVIVCRNCHRKLSDKQKDHPEQGADPPALHERIGHFLLGLADFFEGLIDILRQVGRDLIAFARGTESKNKNDAEA